MRFSVKQRTGVYCSIGDGSLRPRPKFEIIWVCESLAIILSIDVAILPRFEVRDVTHLIYVKIKLYQFLLYFGKDGKLFPQQKVSDEIKFQNTSKRQIKIIYFYVQNATVQDYRRRFTDPYYFKFGSGTQTMATENV